MLVLLLFFVSLGGSTNIKSNYKYVVIGAGPGGLQAAHFMELYRMDYIVLEKSSRAGSFFEHYPRHKKLLSVNKAGNDLRYDWNSLLQDGEGENSADALKMRQITKSFFPNSSQLVQYLNDFAMKYKLRIAYNTEVLNVRKNPSGLFEIEIHDGTVITCSVLLLGTGTPVPHRPKCQNGTEFVTGYEDMSTDLEDYRGKEVMVLGAGNSAAETLDWMQGVAAHVHLGGRHPVIMAHQTHYEGDLRAANLMILDKYQLKSLDAIFSNLFFHQLSLYKENGRIYHRPESEEERISSPLRKGYHYVIRCFGFQWNSSIFDNSTLPRETHLGKYPVMTSTFESSNVQNLFFVGGLMHARDYRVSSGGSIQGFRYLTRTLVHLLRDRYEKVPYPTSNYALQQIPSAILDRLTRSSSLYLMFSNLIDVVVFQPDNTYRYFKDIPIGVIESGLPQPVSFLPKGSTFVTIGFEFGDEFHGAGVMQQMRQKEADYITFRRMLIPDYQEPPEEEYKRRFVGEEKRAWPYMSAPGTERKRDFTNEDIHAILHNSWANVTLPLLKESRFTDPKDRHPVLKKYQRTNQKPTLLDIAHLPVSSHLVWNSETDWKSVHDFFSTKP